MILNKISDEEKFHICCRTGIIREKDENVKKLLSSHKVTSLQTIQI